MKSPPMITFRYTKVKTTHKDFLDATREGFSSKYILEARMKNNVFKNISNGTARHNSSARNINISSKKDFVVTKI